MGFCWAAPVKQKLKTAAIYWLMALISCLSVANLTRAADNGEEAKAAAERKAASEILVYGAVLYPGKQGLGKDEKITLNEVIKRAGGLTRLAARRFTITRVDEKGAVQRIDKNLRSKDSEDGKFVIE